MEEKKKKLQKSYFDVLGLCCASEVTLIENILKPLPGVKEVSVVVPTKTVIVVHDADLITQQEIVKALNQARLEANVRAYGKTSFRKKWPSPFAIACGVLLALSFFKYVFQPMQWLAVAAVAVGIYPVLLKAFAAIRNFRIDVNILMLIAVIGTIAMKDYIESGTIVFLFTTAEWLESRASHKATAVMSSLMSITPQKAVIAETGVEVDVDEVKLNTILAVKAGEVIPLDGVVVDGRCEVDEKTLTGESFPVAKEKDSIVWAGTMNLNGYIRVKTTAIAEDCVVAKMAKLVEEAQNSKSKTQRFIDRCALFYTPAVVLISAGIAVIPIALKFDDRTKWFHLALVVLVSACPCALILSTPVATFCALTQAATSGLLVKGGDYLETLSKIKITAFDKTGTITRGEFSVTDFQSVSEDINRDTLLYWVSSIESKSSHPMATALVEYGRMHSIEPKPENVEDYQNFPGEGIYGKIEGKDIFIGNKRIAERAGGAVPELEGNSKEGKTSGYVFAGAKPVGIFSLSDSCRTGVGEAIKELKSMGIKSAMLTGDNRGAASHVQEQLNNALDIIHAELLPEDKAEIIKNFKKEGPTAMIGDGINDAPALATADIGISMGISGSALATETGHVILMSNDIRKIPKAIKLARRAHRKVIENVFLSISTKAAIIALAIAGHPLVWAAVLCDVGTCLLVILNSMLLLRGNHKHGGNHSHSSHNHKHSHSSGNKVHKGCEAQNCSSQKLTSCGDKQCVSSTKIPTSCEPKRGGCCNKKSSSHDVEALQCASRCESIPPPFNSCGDKQCVSSTKTPTSCEPKRGGCCNKKSSSHDVEAQECASRCESISPPLNSCGDKQCVSSTKEHDICVLKEETLEPKQGGCCNKPSLDIEAQRCSSQKCASKSEPIPPPLNSCGDNRCVSSTKEHDICVLMEETLESKQRGCCNKPSLDIEAQRCSYKKCASKSEPIPPPLNSSGDNLCVSSTKQGGCCSKASPVTEAVNCCSATPSEKKSSCEENHSKVETVVENCCSKVQDPEPHKCSATASCKSSEKREVGCCKSYMKECCSKKHGQFGAGFGGGLTEIITE